MRACRPPRRNLACARSRPTNGEHLRMTHGGLPPEPVTSRNARWRSISPSPPDAGRRDGERRRGWFRFPFLQISPHSFLVGRDGTGVFTRCRPLARRPARQVGGASSGSGQECPRSNYPAWWFWKNLSCVPCRRGVAPTLVILNSAVQKPRMTRITRMGTGLVRDENLFRGHPPGEHPFHRNPFLIRVIREIRGSNCCF